VRTRRWWGPFLAVRVFRNNPGSLAIFAAIRRTSSLLSSLAADRKTRLERAAVTQVNGDRLMLKGYP
jgi:hypothetical protein